MTVRNALTVLAMALVLGACGGDDNDGSVDNPPTPTPPPPQEESIGIDETTSLALTLEAFDGPSGAVTFSLTGDDQLPVTGVERFRLLYLGYPPAGPTSVKYALPWHQTEDYDCLDAEADCLMVLEETSLGQYEVLPTELYWQELIEDHKVMIEVVGDQAQSPPVWN
ncbi:hypothetical protein [Ferrimonas marina]|uniref:Lipoprotein n=1 Tax=Ferrimonas marina TaxID=299255 RepID=A0A1M5NX26_9GAMM|nr:hypothetical protein [Ferrimonas marina]SHG94144.1 hypothetical protein SAMN02745129_1211 [Ferrimonas marina]